MKRKVCLALVVVVLVGTAFNPSSSSLPFLNDNFRKALIEAQQRNVPIFVECWAPW